MTQAYPLAATPDLPGHGSEPLVHPPLVEIYANVLASKVPRGAVLIGHSLGGMVALELGARLGDRISALILIEAVPTVRDRLSRRIASFVAQSIYKVVPPKWLASLSGVGQSAHTRAELHRQLAGTDRRRITAALQAAAQYDGRPLLPRITVPTLVIVGQDNKATHCGAKLMAEGIPAAEHVVLSGGHMLHTDNPTGLLTTINEFLGPSDLKSAIQSPHLSGPASADTD